MREKSQRLMYIDISKGIAALLIVIGHLISKPIVHHSIFTMHVPLFLIISGYFFSDRGAYQNMQQDF